MMTINDNGSIYYFPHVWKYTIEDRMMLPCASFFSKYLYNGNINPCPYSLICCDINTREPCQAAFIWP